MLDDGFTYGGELLSIAALALWIWLAVRAFPSLDALVRRYELDGDPDPAQTWSSQAGGLGRLAAGVTVLALTFSAIGYAIPD